MCRLYRNFVRPAWVGWLYIPKSVCGRVWGGLHLQYPIRGQIVMSCYFHVPFYLKTPSIKQMFVDKMLINLLKRVASLDSYGIQGRKGYFGCPHTVLGRYSQPDPELINEWSLLLLSTSSMGVVGYIFLTLYVGGWVGGLLMAGTPEG